MSHFITSELKMFFYTEASCLYVTFDQIITIPQYQTCFLESDVGIVLTIQCI